MEDEDYKRYVCVEPGCVNGMTTVEAKKELVLKQTIVVVEEMWIVCWILEEGGCDWNSLVASAHGMKLVNHLYLFIYLIIYI